MNDERSNILPGVLAGILSGLVLGYPAHAFVMHRATERVEWPWESVLVTRSDVLPGANTASLWADRLPEQCRGPAMVNPDELPALRRHVVRVRLTEGQPVLRPFLDTTKSRCVTLVRKVVEQAGSRAPADAPEVVRALEGRLGPVLP